MIKEKPNYRLHITDAVVVGVRTNRDDNYAEMHIINKKTGVHLWEVNRFIGAMDMINGKSGRTYTPQYA